MDKIETKILRDRWDVDLRLSELRLPRQKLLNARDIALHEAANATPYHCATAPGTFAYHHGTWAIRNELVGEEWKLDRAGGVESIINKTLNIRVIYCNVDIACDYERKPKPRSKKGAGSERVCIGNLFGHLPEYAPRPDGREAVYYLMVDEEGAAELTRPVVKNNTFNAYIERLYLSDGSDSQGGRLPLNADDALVDFDPKVVRK